MGVAVKRSPIEKAKNYESKALKLSINAAKLYPLKKSKADEIKLQAGELYELAGDNWVREFSENMQKPETMRNYRQILNSLTFAVNNYQSASNILKPYSDIYDLKKKMESVKRKKEEFEKKENERKKINSLESKLGLYSVLSIVSLALALFLVSFNLTGNSIGGINVGDLKWISACFFLCGLFFTFVHLKEKRKF